MRLQTEPSQAEVLGGVLRLVRELGLRGGRPLVLFDLDDTLLATTRRNPGVRGHPSGRHEDGG